MVKLRFSNFQNLMNPEIFINQPEIRHLSKTLLKFATKVQATERQDVLSLVDPDFLVGLNFNATPISFANSLLAKFKEYKVSAQILQHPMVDFFDFLLETDATQYGFEDQDINLCRQLVKRGQENLKILGTRHAVCRIESPKNNGIGTGTLVGEDLLLTCRHVILNLSQAWIRFNYYHQDSYSLDDYYFELDLTPVSTYGQLDYALLRILGKPQQQILALTQTQLSAEQTIQIIHHPLGQPMQVDKGHIQQVGSDYIDHDIKTREGSSGAPIFNEHWECVAIHRGHPGIGREIPPDTMEGVPIHAFLDKLSI